MIWLMASFVEQKFINLSDRQIYTRNVEGWTAYEWIAHIKSSKGRGKNSVEDVKDQDQTEVIMRKKYIMSRIC